VLYETIGQKEDAEKEYRLAVKYDPTDGDVNNNLGAFLCGTGRRAEAQQHFQVALDDPFYQTQEVALSNAGSCALAAGDLDKAESFLRQSLEHNDKLGAALLPMAEVSYRKGSYLKARGFLQRYEAVGDKTAESLSLGVRIETKLGDEEAAQRYRTELSEQYPGSIQVGRKADQEQK
jgi:type IV pilus assembly protein PilF